MLVFLFITLAVVHPISGSPTPLPSLHANCTFQHGNKFLTEGEKVTIKGKLYKFEDCHLQRAYQTCGTYLWFMINIVCEAIEVQKQKNKQGNPFRRFVQEKLLTDACCENSCTIVEMTRYCP